MRLRIGAPHEIIHAYIGELRARLLCFFIQRFPDEDDATACTLIFVDSEGTDENNAISPSTSVGCAQMASRSAVYGNPAIMAVCTEAMISPASTAKAVKPRMIHLCTCARSPQRAVLGRRMSRPQSSIRCLHPGSRCHTLPTCQRGSHWQRKAFCYHSSSCQQHNATRGPSRNGLAWTKSSVATGFAARC
jgi:hypothetical protein